MILVKTNEFNNLNKIEPKYVKLKKVILLNGKFHEKEIQMTQDQHFKQQIKDKLLYVR